MFDRSDARACTADLLITSCRHGYSNGALIRSFAALSHDPLEVSVAGNPERCTTSPSHSGPSSAVGSSIHLTSICPRRRRVRTVGSSASCDASASSGAIPRSRSTTAGPARGRGPFLMAANDERVLRSDGSYLVRIVVSAGSTIVDVHRTRCGTSRPIEKHNPCDACRARGPQTLRLTGVRGLQFANPSYDRSGGTRGPLACAIPLSTVATFNRLPLDVNLQCLRVGDHAVQPCETSDYPQTRE
jgi:hypothetical protein